jgi:hypothetical protein
VLQWGAVVGKDWLPEGSPAPEFGGPELRSGHYTSSRDLDGRGVIILFLSPECEVCKSLADSLRAAGTEAPPVIALCQGGEQACAGFATRLGKEVPLLFRGAQETAAAYGVSGFPTAVVVDTKRKIRAYGQPRDIGDLKSLWADSPGQDRFPRDRFGSGTIAAPLSSSERL